MLAVERAARGGGVDPLEGRRRSHEPIAAECDTGLRIEQRSKRIRQLRALRTDHALRPSAVVDGVIRLRARNYAELRETWDVGCAQMLRMLDAKAAVARTIFVN